MNFRGVMTLGFGFVLLFVLFVFAKVGGGFLSWFLFYVFIALFLYELATRWFTMRKLFMVRRVSTNHLSASQLLDVEITFSRKHFWPMFWAKISDELPDLLSVRADGAVQTVIPLWSRQFVCKYHVSDLPRGIHHLDEIRIESGDLLGLQRFTKSSAQYEQIVVYPRIVPVRGWQTAKADFGGQQSTLRRAEESSNVIGVRQYAPGDRLSRIHWPASARTGALLSKEFEQRVTSDYMFIPDASAESFSKTNREKLFDLEMTIVASLMKYAMDSRYRFGAAIHSNRLMRFEPGRGESLFLKCMETFAELQPACQTSFAVSFERMARELPSGCTFVIISPSFSKEMILAVSNMRKRGIVEWFVPVSGEGLKQEEIERMREMQSGRVHIHFVSSAEQLSDLGRGGTLFATK
jgi:uncharacterized protein (DUF58 family)